MSITGWIISAAVLAFSATALTVFALANRRCKTCGWPLIMSDQSGCAEGRCAENSRAKPK